MTHDDQVRLKAPTLIAVQYACLAVPAATNFAVFDAGGLTGLGDNGGSPLRILLRRFTEMACTRGTGSEFDRPAVRGVAVRFGPDFPAHF
jgi:hypothetical protein